MSFVGKVLIVVQVVMSLCFMAFAGAVYVTTDNWKTKHEQSEEQLGSMKTSIANVEASLSQARDERAAVESTLKQEADKWKLAFQNEEAQVKDLTGRLNNINNGLERQTAIAQSAQTEAGNREKESEVLRKQNIDLQKRIDEVSAELNTERDKSFNSEVALRQLEERFGKLQVQTAFLEKIVRKYDLPTDPAIVEGLENPPPKLDGLVEQVEKGKTNRTRYVVISVGQDDGLRVGHELEVLGARQQKTIYLGAVKVISVEADKAVCEVVAPSKLGDIEVGDNVTTKL
ncbi:MAG: hypothetical protein KDA75_12405 [Planctomycetaceae bacterium]|nr:hypothetical protein [Planctomycetaceae bacterium]